MPKTKAKPMSAQEFRAKIKVKTTPWQKWLVRIDTPDNAYSRTYDKSITRDEAVSQFINIWYDVYLDDMGDFN